MYNFFRELETWLKELDLSQWEFIYAARLISKAKRITDFLWAYNYGKGDENDYCLEPYEIWDDMVETVINDKDKDEFDYGSEYRPKASVWEAFVAWVNDIMFIKRIWEQRWGIDLDIELEPVVAYELFMRRLYRDEERIKPEMPTKKEDHTDVLCRDIRHLHEMSGLKQADTKVIPQVISELGDRIEFLLKGDE